MGIAATKWSSEKNKQLSVHASLKEAWKGKVDVDEKSFADLCFDFGLELDEITSEKEMAAKERGADSTKGLGNRTIYKVDLLDLVEDLYVFCILRPWDL